MLSWIVASNDGAWRSVMPEEPDHMSFGRRMRASLITAALAPYLSTLILFLLLLVTDPEAGTGEIWEVLGLLVAGTIGLLFYGWIVFLLAYLAITIADHFEAATRPVAVIAGTVLGLTFAYLTNAMSIRVPWMISHGIAGSICGWICWRIATGGSRV